MNYEILHMESDMHKVKTDLWHSLIFLIENENSFEDIVSKFDVIVEQYNDTEKGSFMNVPENYDFVVSTFKDETQIRIAEGVNDDDFIVVNVIDN